MLDLLAAIFCTALYAAVSIDPNACVLGYLLRAPTVLAPAPVTRRRSGLLRHEGLEHRTLTVFRCRKQPGRRRALWTPFGTIIGWPWIT